MTRVEALSSARFFSSERVITPLSAPKSEWNFVSCQAVRRFEDLALRLEELGKSLLSEEASFDPEEFSFTLSHFEKVCRETGNQFPYSVPITPEMKMVQTEKNVASQIPSEHNILPPDLNPNSKGRFTFNSNGCSWEWEDSPLTRSVSVVRGDSFFGPPSIKGLVFKVEDPKVTLLEVGIPSAPRGLFGFLLECNCSVLNYFETQSLHRLRDMPLPLEEQGAEILDFCRLNFSCQKTFDHNVLGGGWRLLYRPESDDTPEALEIYFPKTYRNTIRPSGRAFIIEEGKASALSLTRFFKKEIALKRVLVREEIYSKGQKAGDVIPQEFINVLDKTPFYFPHPTTYSDPKALDGVVFELRKNPAAVSF